MILIDSANISEIREALELGYVTGVTTNPLLMAQTTGPWRDTLKKICEQSPGDVFYQVDAVEVGSWIETVRSIDQTVPGKIVVKLPAIHSGFQVASAVADKIRCCITAVYSLSQLTVAQAVGAHYIAVYVNRTNKFYKERKEGACSDGFDLIRDMRNLIEQNRWSIKILAASLKTPQEIAQAFKAGAHHVTAGLDVLKDMASNPLSDEAQKEFANAIQETK